jgi:hypothetical protein
LRAAAERVIVGQTERDMDDWKPFNEGRTIGTIGSERGTILLDDEHSGGARITIEEGGHIAPFSITCGIYGWMVHTRFFATEVEARRECAEMKPALSALITTLGRVANGSEELGESCSSFVDRFP